LVPTVGIGIRMRTLWGLKAGVLASLAVALLAALWSVDRISVLPPGLTPRSLEMATAAAHVVVDTPSSALLDLRQDTYSFEGLRNRAVLLGNVVSSSTVRQNIARRTHVPLEVLRIQAPLTAQQSAPAVDSDTARHTSDILRANDQYRLTLQANPSVPMLDFYAQAPTAQAAAALANVAVEELRAYLARLAVTQRTPAKAQIHVVQLGRAQGTVINKGINWQVALLTFLLTFGACCATVIFLSRVRAGWRIAALYEGAPSA
jgi:hypothetical protein